MKKLIAIILSLMLLGGVALAESAITPDEYLASRGLMVLDEYTLAGMGVDMDDINFDCRFAILSIDGDTSAICYKDDKIYMAFETGAMLGEPTMDAKTMTGIYSDFCMTTEFDLYSYTTTDNTSHAYFAIDNIEDILPDDIDLSSVIIYDTFDDYMASLDNIE